ncbi:dynamin family protein [Hypoxylon trugodes]|uniref:dynamin family protein n=1 Tax=Hypoxylon trugodes TaxID=326681 RepID=UPI0021974058|nr:dynamin family protein [Hypoxylon trugodes]KAI1388076.1 dynamin family protein [Hypoxylon trugodes]
MVLAFSTESLNGLCSDDQLELLDAIDHLRLQGIDHYISLPQIIVCGDQSSGKSSVLEAISGVPFPVKSNLCTCFPTELVLRRTPETGVTVSIVPDSSYNSTENGLHKFHEELDGFEGFPDLVEKAKVAMGITTLGKAFSKDRLRVEITGPDRPHLTIIDMPGLIHSETKTQSKTDVRLVRQVVRSYMKQPRSIILAVVSAKNDFANQAVLNFAREVDERGSRTMGVITKPDCLVEGSGSEKAFISLARNNQVNFDLGWHVLKNLDSETQKGSSLLNQRNVEEARFFSRGAWKELPPSMLGINELRKRLSDVLLKQIAFELPSLIREIESGLDESREKLKELGEPRRTYDEQRLQLLQVSQGFQSLVEGSVSGSYDDPFFEDAQSDKGYEQRIRSVIQNMNKEFADEITAHGHRREVGSKSQTPDQNPEYVTREVFLDHVQSMMQRTRGQELPGIFSPLVVADLFRQQSSPWEEIARGHVKKAWDSAVKFLELVIEHVADPSISNSLLEKVIRPALKTLLTDAEVKTAELLKSHHRVHPITYNQEYAETIHFPGSHSREEISNIVRSFFGLSSISNGNQYLNNNNYNLSRLVDNLSKRVEPTTERLAASEALDRMLAYYYIALKRFIDGIAIEVIEQKILVPLSDILSPVAVFKMPAKVADLIAGESWESRSKRQDLTKKIDVLREGLGTCERFVSSRLKDEQNSQQEEAAGEDLDTSDLSVGIPTASDTEEAGVV